MFITIALIPIFKTLALKTGIVDMPNSRKVHAVPMPKIGGIAIACGTLIPILFLKRFYPIDRFLWSLVGGAMIIVLFGFLDDMKNLGYKTKFLGQIIAALIVIVFGDLKITHLSLGRPDIYGIPEFLSLPLTLITIVGVTNAINLSDGLDGLAGGISLISFLCIGFLAFCCENMVVAVFSAAMVGGLFGFLRFNTFPATLFMGDAGSQFIGFLAITLCLALTQDYTPLSPLLPLLLIGLPILDTLAVMTVRVSRGNSPFAADKNHFHHKLMGLGLYHTEAVFVIYVIQTIFVGFAFFFRFYPEWTLLAFYGIFSSVIFFLVFWGHKKAFRFQRPGLLDRMIKNHFTIIKEEQTIIRLSFGAVELIAPLVLIFNCLLPMTIPSHVSVMCLIFFVVTMYVSIFKKEWLGGALRLSLYLLIPFLVYTSKTELAHWATHSVLRYCNAIYGILAILVIFSIKFTRRKKGFVVSPLDYIVLIAALVIPNLPDPRIQNLQMGMVATQIIVLLFTFEMWICELRGRLGRVEVTAMAALLVVAGRGIL